MLTTETKRKIDNLRDTLVGKIPVPSQQVELITLGLIYKFMSDIDEQNLELGAKDSFFNGKYKQYAWSHIIDRSLSGQERTVLFAEGLEKMASNPNLPQLFRDIFKGAYLPFKDPVVLDHFLKGINELGYTHSEELGNAFEYLLSVMGSQGDAGQFRTPRHVIDFLVKAVNPKKEDTILDPACGTAGFLISAYKHILEENTKKGGHPGSALSSTDRKKLTQNFQGYDISHDMVRLSLANMYLHNFPEPKIFEYDTLSDDTRWDHTFDCILANPPFMSPRGGIRPHNRFSVQSKRSEVLFVDYIAEHLNPNGKAGVIVPEGIVFQNGTTYKQLRKMLVEENYLWAVVSLPSGAFNPYSGVKTSILLFDKALAKKTDDILFIDIEKDGYGLGAQRRALCSDVENPAWCPEHSDLPKALNTINAFKEYVRGSYQGGNLYVDFYIRDKEQKESGQLWSAFYENTTFVNKKFIKEDENYSLNAGKYKELDKVYDGNWPLVELGEICDLQNGFAFKSSEYVDDGLRVIRITNVQKGEIVDDNPKFVSGSRKDEFKNWMLSKSDILISLTGNVGRVGLLKEEHLPAVLNQRVAKISPDESKINKLFLFYILNSDLFEKSAISSASGIAQKNLSTNWLAKYKIPLPPLEVQKEIVAELESYKKIIDGARQIIDNYKPSITINPEWDIVPLKQIVKIARGGSPRPINDYLTENEEGVNWIKIGDAKEGSKYITGTKQKIKPKGVSRSRQVKEGDFLLSNSMSFGRPYILKTNGCIHDGWLLLRPDKSKITEDFLYYILGSTYVNRQFEKAATGGVVKNLNSDLVSNVNVPLPKPNEQKGIVTKLEKEQEHVNSAQETVDLFEEKIKEKISEVWGE